jgi:4'-phosphopantetheinyl transferase
MTAVISSLFEEGPARPALNPGEAHLWRAHLGSAGQSTSGRRPEDSLSRDEHERAARFYFQRDRDRFIASRRALRAILSRYLEVNPHTLPFTTGPHGKPKLEGLGSALRFNLSHSDELLLVAVAGGREIGVDVEKMREAVNFDLLAEHYFDPADAGTLRSLPSPAKVEKFYELWTRTEACLKAAGTGFMNGAKIIEPDRWSLLKLTPAEGYAAALAVEGGKFHLKCWSWAG